MKKNAKWVILGVLLLLICLIAVSQRNKSRKESETEMNNKGQLENLLECSKEEADKITSLFEKHTKEQIVELEMIPTNKKSYLLKATTENNVYYLYITSTKMLREIRKDEEKGKIIYQVLF